MAGIGFVLRKLTAKDDLMGYARAFVHSAFASVGPWIITVITLGTISMMFRDAFAVETLLNFRIVVIYNFAFSLVLSAPVYMVITRYLADKIHFHNVTDTPSVMLGSIIKIYVIQIIVALIFYFGYFNLSLPMRFSATVNLILVTSIWTIAIYMSALKDYMMITWAFLVGMTVSFFAAEFLKPMYGAVGMLNGFNIGLVIIVFALAGKVFAEYPYRLRNLFAAKNYYRKYWELALSGVFYNAAIWIDKWIMWLFAPEAVVLPSKMRMFPDYDSAMFLAYLTIVPSMAMFVFSVETNFFQRYQRFYYDILEHAPMSRIRDNHRGIVDTLMGSARNFVVVQGIICFLAIVLAPQLFALIGFNYLDIGIFRFGVLAAFFHVLVLFQTIILSYFDVRRTVMYIQFFFMLTNAVFSYVTIGWGFPYYGYGYFLSTVVMFIVTSFVLFAHIRHLPYHAFITSNNSLKKNWTLN